jgi:hypothetical protein
VIVSCEALAELYEPINAHVYVARNAIDPADWPEPTKPRRDVFRVGFAGSSSHASDLHLVVDALRWASEREGLEAVVVGFDPGDVAPEKDLLAVRRIIERRERSRDAATRQRLLREASEYVDRHRARWSFPLTLVPWTNKLARYRRNLGGLDIALCPVDETASSFARWRSDVKVLELAMSGALPIISDARCYAEWREVLPVARDAAEFLDLVQWAASHPAEVRARRAALREHVLATRTIETEVEAWRAAIEGAPQALDRDPCGRREGGCA